MIDRCTGSSRPVLGSEAERSDPRGKEEGVKMSDRSLIILGAGLARLATDCDDLEKGRTRGE